MGNVVLNVIAGLLVALAGNAALTYYQLNEIRGFMGRAQQAQAELQIGLRGVQSEVSRVATQLDRLVESSFLREDAAKVHGCINNASVMIIATSCTTTAPCTDFSVGTAVAIKLHESWPAIIVTAAHVVYDKWNTEQASKYTNIYARLDHSDVATPVFSCSVKNEWQTAEGLNSSVGKSKTDIVVLNCSSGEVAQSLDALLSDSALLAASEAPLLWQPLAFGGFVRSAHFDRKVRSVQLPALKAFGSFVLMRGNAAVPSAGVPQRTSSLIQLHGWSDSGAGASSSGSHTEPLEMIDSTIPRGCSGGAVIGKQCQMYGIAHGYGVVGVYSTLHHLLRTCRDEPDTYFCKPVAMNLSKLIANLALPF